MRSPSPLSVSRPPARPLLVYDGDCAFCRRWVSRWRAETGDALDFEPFQAAASRFPEIPRKAFERSVVLVEPGGRVFGGAEAVFRSLSVAPGKGLGLRLYRRLPGFAPLAEAAYGLIASHRTAANRLTVLLWGRSVDPPSFRAASALFLKGLCLVYACAFLSLFVQAEGLLGREGLLPVPDFLSRVRNAWGDWAPLHLPTVFWAEGSGPALRAACLAGTAAAAAAFLGLLPRAALFWCWALWLSLVNAGQAFLSFQWDVLLCEAGILAVLLAPGGVRVPFRAAPPPPWIPHLLLRWLTFRLFFLSGVVKLTSGDVTWRAGTALTYHYETQPLPTPPAWYFHQLPLGFHEAACTLVFILELGFPFLLFAPRRLRHLGALGLLALLGLIAFTGNYAFFNLLSAFLLLLFLDDSLFARLRRERREGAAPPRWRPSGVPLRALGAALFLLTLSPLLRTLGAPGLAPPPLPWLERELSFWRVSNGYGLFAVMTTVRDEILVEGSRDGREWKAYGFRYKPQDPREAPPWVAPHQPRLDWQMWFAALSHPAAEPWFLRLCGALLEGRKPVLELLASNPFPGAPPLKVRARRVRYSFTDRKTREETKAWWATEEKGLYLPPVPQEEKK